MQVRRLIRRVENKTIKYTVYALLCTEASHLHSEDVEQGDIPLWLFPVSWNLEPLRFLGCGVPTRLEVCLGCHCTLLRILSFVIDGGKLVTSFPSADI